MSKNSDDDKTQPLSQLTQFDHLNDDFGDQGLVVGSKDDADFPERVFETYEEALRASKRGDSIFLRGNKYDTIKLLPERKIVGEGCSISQIITLSSEWNSKDTAYLIGLKITSIDNSSNGTIRCQSCSFETDTFKGNSIILNKCYLDCIFNCDFSSQTLFNMTAINCKLKIEVKGSNNQFLVAKDTPIKHSRIFVIFSGDNNKLSFTSPNIQYNIINIIKNDHFDKKNIITNEGHNIFQCYPDLLGQPYWDIKENTDDLIIFEDSALKPENEYIVVGGGGKIITITMPKLDEMKHPIIVTSISLGKNNHYIIPQADEKISFDGKTLNKITIEAGNTYVFEASKDYWKVSDNFMNF